MRVRERGNTRVIGIPAFMDVKNLQPLISKDLKEMIRKIAYADKNNKKYAEYQRELFDNIEP